MKRQFGKTQHTVAMEQNLENYDLKGANVKILKKNTDNVIIKSHKCNQCDYASSRAGNLRTHLKTHSGEKPNKCTQCDYVSFEAGTLRTHIKIHSGEKSKNETNMTLHPQMQVDEKFVNAQLKLM